MKKKILAILITALISVSFISCSDTSSNKESVKTTDNSIEAKKEMYDKLDGIWTEEVSRKQYITKFKDVLEKVEEKNRFYGLEYSKNEDAIKENGDESISETYVYLDQENPEVNRLESLYFGSTLFGTTQNSGQIIMKTSLNFDGKSALKDGDFDFGETSLAVYAELFTNVTDRDYSDINRKIVEVLKSESGEGVISDNISGLYEEYTITKEYIVYTLETKIINFISEDEVFETK